jgi:hypothetical protein
MFYLAWLIYLIPLRGKEGARVVCPDSREGSVVLKDDACNREIWSQTNANIDAAAAGNAARRSA